MGFATSLLLRLISSSHAFLHGEKAMEPKRMVLSEAEAAPPPEPTVPESREATADAQPHMDELCRTLCDPQIRSELARVGIQINLTRNLQAGGNGANAPKVESGQLSQDLTEVKDFAVHIGGLEKLKEMVNMLISLKE
jgi:hypothetical protein